LGHLRKNQIAGKHFRHQHQVGNYVADFICIPDRLVIDVDGSQPLKVVAGCLLRAS
jgi:very-short-patch-repair endonuclease